MSNGLTGIRCMEESNSAETASEQPSINYEELFSLLWGSRKLIGIITASATVAAIIISLLLFPRTTSQPL